MTVVMLLTNVVFAALVLTAMIALHGRAIVADLAHHKREARLARAPRTRSARWEPRVQPAH